MPNRDGTGPAGGGPGSGRGRGRCGGRGGADNPGGKADLLGRLAAEAASWLLSSRGQRPKSPDDKPKS